MKRKLLLLSIPLLLCAKLSHAQWNTADTTVHYSYGKVGVGTISPAADVHIHNNVGYLNNSNNQLLFTNSGYRNSEVLLPSADMAAFAYYVTNYNAGIKGYDRTLDLKVRGNGDGTFGASMIRFFASDYTSGATEREIMRIHGTGKVGINTNNPGSRLEVLETAESRPGALSAPTASVLKLSRMGTAYYAYGEASEFRIGHGGPSVSGTQLDLYVNGASNTTGVPDKQVMTWQYNGGVGIGTTTPANSDQGARTLQLGNQMILQNVLSNQVLFANNAYYDGNGWFNAAAGKSSGLRMYDGGVDLFTNGSADAGANISSTWTSKFSVTNSGDVGVGTTMPASRLEVYDNTLSKPAGVNAPTTSVLKFSRSGTNNYAYNEASEFRIGHGGPSVFGSQVDLYVNGPSNTTGVPDQQAMTWQYNGNVGIGTVNPDQKLSVAGTIHAQAVKVDMTGWSDYVFKPQYHLNTLAQTKAYIDKNHHLPGVPSETEVIANGLDLGEMNKLLLKKVEELTLHLIEQDKESKSHLKQINNLNKQMAALLMAKSPKQ